jgi:hypothetical protein
LVDAQLSEEDHLFDATPRLDGLRRDAEVAHHACVDPDDVGICRLFRFMPVTAGWRLSGRFRAACAGEAEHAQADH